MMLGLPNTQVWRLTLSCHCAGILIDCKRGPDLSKPFTCPACNEIATPVSAMRWDERLRLIFIGQMPE
jgi:hypothetical protein